MADQLLPFIIGIAVFAWLAGWLLLIFDTISGYRFADKYPLIGKGLGTVLKYSLMGIGILIAAQFLVLGPPNREYDPRCHIWQTGFGQDTNC